MALGSKVKGITIEFDGDTTKLGRALATVNAQARSVDKQLKDINRSLRFNPHNTELLAQKQQLLRQKVSQTQLKLEQLKKAERQMAADPSVDKHGADYMELRREIIKTESQLKYYERELRNLNGYKLTALGNQIKGVGDKMQKAGQQLTKYLSGPIAALGALSLYSFMQVDKGLDIVTKKTGASGDELDKMHQIVKNIASTTPSDFETIGSAVGEVNTRFGVTGTELETLSNKFIKFASLNETDVSTSIDQTQKALSAFGLGVEHAGPLLDQLNTVGQQTGVSMDTLLNGLIQNGTAFQEMGLSVGQSAVLMGQMEKSGANAETVMQGLRKALKNATAEGVPLDVALADLQDTIQNGKGGVDGLTKSYELFGKSGDQIYSAVKNGTLDFSQLGAVAEATGTTVEGTFENTLSPMEQFKATLNNLKVVGYEIGASLGTVLQPILENIAQKVQQLANWWNNLSPAMQNFIIKIAMIAATVGPAILVIGKLVSTVGTLITMVPKIIQGIGLISKVIAANPWMLLIMGIVAAIILIATHWEQVKAVILKVWNVLKKVAQTVWNAIKASIVGPLQIAYNVVKTVVNAIKKVFNFGPVKTAVTTVFNAIKTAIVTPIKTAYNIIKGVVDTIKNLFNFTAKTPKIKLPHFSITPAGWKLPDLLEGKIPKLGIKWYKTGGIFNSPSVIGVGEAGAEAVVPLNKLWDKMDNIAAGTGGVTINVYPSAGMNTSELAAEVERRLIEHEKRRRAVWA